MATIANIEILTRFLTRTDTTSLTAAQLLILDNKYYEQIVGRIISETAGAQWQFGDFNYTSFPTFTQDLVNSQAEYPLTGVNTRPMTIMGVEVVDESGNPHPLQRITLKQIQDSGVGQADYASDDGRPNQYELRDNIMVMYPAPDNGLTVTLTAGLIVFYLRTADVFTSSEVSTGTKVPGFPVPWHDLMSYGPAYDYSLSVENFTRASFFKAEYDKRMEEMLDFISRRDQAVVDRLIPRRKRFR